MIDIGANQGFFSCYAAHRGARVYAYEPSPALFEQLQENIRANGFSERVQASPCGVGDHEGTAVLTLTDMFGGGMNSIVPDFSDHHKMNRDRNITIPLTTFSALLKNNALDRVRLCKIDCEGAELMIVKSIDAATATRVDAFVIEYHWDAYPFADLIEHLLGWRTHQISYAEDKYCMRTILRAVRSDLLQKGP